MPDIAATRPVSGQPIETSWGDNVHDLIEGIQAGSLSMSFVNNSVVDAAITFPRPYVSAPIVFANVMTQTSSGYAIAYGATTTGCSLRIVQKDALATNASLNVAWLAIGTAVAA